MSREKLKTEQKKKKVGSNNTQTFKCVHLSALSFICKLHMCKHSEITEIKSVFKPFNSLILYQTILLQSTDTKLNCLTGRELSHPCNAGCLTPLLLVGRQFTVRKLMVSFLKRHIMGRLGRSQIQVRPVAVGINKTEQLY